MSFDFVSTPAAQPRTAAEVTTTEFAPSRLAGPVYGPALRDELLSSFGGPSKAVRLPLMYRLGLTVVALVMVLLPLIYLLMIAAVCFGVYFYFTHVPAPTVIHVPKAAIVVWGLYLSPLFIGPLLVLFMIKPLAARPARPHVLYTLSRQKEPLLFVFLERVCRLVGAAIPKRIDVDCEINASARFRRGFLSFFGRDLVLTLGLPLTSGLSLAQLTGVLAHELGHFAQGAGMRVSYLVRSINSWFARVVYHRDELDEWLETSVRESERFVVLVVLQVCRFFVWLTRRILWCLSWIGHAVSCFLMRQMEFDADRHQVRMVGSSVFESTMFEVLTLGLAHQQALSGLQQSSQEGRLVDDLPALTLLQRRQLPRGVQQALAEHMRTAGTGLFDTHPSHQARIANARRHDQTPLFRSTLPAAALFRDFGQLSRDVSRAFYRAVLGDAFEAHALVESSSIAERQEKVVGDQDALERYFGAAVNPLRPLGLRKLAEPPADANAAFASLEAARGAVERAAPEHRRRLLRYQSACEQLILALKARALLQAKITIRCQDFGLPRGDEATAEQGVARAQERLQAAANQLAPLEAAFGTRAMSALQLLRFPDTAQRVEDAPAMREEVRTVFRPLAQLGGLFETTAEVRNLRAVIGILGANLGNAVDADATPLRASAQELEHRLGRMMDQLSGTPYPFDHNDAAVTLQTYVFPQAPLADIGQLYELSETVLDRFFEVYFRLWGRLARIGERLEAAVGLEPLAALGGDPS